MASKNKRKRRALQREEQRIKRLKEQHATELEELRQSSAATDAELEAFYSRLDGAATRNVEDARHRPTYAPEYIPYDPRLRVQSPGDPIEAGEPWPELKDDNRITEKDRRSSSHLRLPPPRADDYKLISVYEAIGITEEDLSRDRNERHMEKAEKLTTSYENFRFDEEEIKGGDIGNACYTGSGRFSTPSRILDFSDEDMEVRVRGGDSQGERYTDTTASHENVCSGKEAETIEMVIRDNCARGEGQAEKEDILPAFHQSVRPGEVGMADKDKVTGGDQGEQASGASDLSSMTMGSNRNEELSRSEGAKEGQCAEKGEDDAWWLCHPDDLGSPMDIHGNSSSSEPETRIHNEKISSGLRSKDPARVKTEVPSTPAVAQSGVSLRESNRCHRESQGEDGSKAFLSGVKHWLSQLPIPINGRRVFRAATLIS